MFYRYVATLMLYQFTFYLRFLDNLTISFIPTVYLFNYQVRILIHHLLLSRIGNEREIVLYAVNKNVYSVGL